MYHRSCDSCRMSCQRTQSFPCPKEWKECKHGVVSCRYLYENLRAESRSESNTAYKYETYKTNNDGVAKVSLPNDDVDYYAKVIDDDNNCFNLKTAYRIVPTDKSINSVIEADNNLPSILNNPKTGDKLLILLLIIVISLGLGTFIYKKKINSY